MDRHGILALARRAAAAFKDKAEGKRTFDPQWRWNHDMLICPEIPCFACNKPCKTNIVIVYDENSKRMIGQFTIRKKKLKVGDIYHTHAHGVSGSICMGNAKSLTQLLYSPPNAHGNWEWDVKMVRWYHRYAHHDCPQMHQWWEKSFPGLAYPWDGPFKKNHDGPRRLSLWEVRGTPLEERYRETSRGEDGERVFTVDTNEKLIGEEDDE